MSTLLRVGQVLKGRISTYTIMKELRGTVWFAINQAKETVVIKGVQDHPRVENEQDILKRFQGRTRYLRPLIDEIEDPPSPVIIALKHLHSDIWREDVKKPLKRVEMRYVSRCILEALAILHEDGYVHADVKLDNIFVNLREGENRFSDVQLGDLGECYHMESKWARSGAFVGTPIFSSPEVLLEIPWNTAADIWSFGTVLINLIYGRNMEFFHHKDQPDFSTYVLGVLKNQFRYFGPFPAKFGEIADSDAVKVVLYMMDTIPGEKLTGFHRITAREVIQKDKEFIGKIMKLDWRDRPTAKGLLKDQCGMRRRRGTSASRASGTGCEVGERAQGKIRGGQVE